MESHKLRQKRCSNSPAASWCPPGEGDNMALRKWDTISRMARSDVVHHFLSVHSSVRRWRLQTSVVREASQTHVQHIAALSEHRQLIATFCFVSSSPFLTTLRCRNFFLQARLDSCKVTTFLDATKGLYSEKHKQMIHLFICLSAEKL